MKKILLLSLVISLNIFSFQMSDVDLYKSLNSVSLTFKSAAVYDIDINNKMIPYDLIAVKFPNGAELLYKWEGDILLRMAKPFGIFKKYREYHFTYFIWILDKWPVFAIRRNDTLELQGSYLNTTEGTVTYEYIYDYVKNKKKNILLKARNKMIITFEIESNASKTIDFINMANEMKKDGHITEEELAELKGKINAYTGPSIKKNKLNLLYDDLAKYNDKVAKLDYLKGSTINLELCVWTIEEMQNNGWWDTRLFLEDKLSFNLSTGQEVFQETFKFKMGFTNRIYEVPYKLYINDNGEKILEVTYLYTGETKRFVLNDLNNKRLHMTFNKSSRIPVVQHPIELEFKINFDNPK